MDSIDSIVDTRGSFDGKIGKCLFKRGQQGGHITLRERERTGVPNPISQLQMPALTQCARRHA